MPQPSLSAGRLDRQIILKTALKSQDANSGEELIDWDQFDVVLWAEWLPAGTSEAWQAQERLEAYVDGVFKVYDRVPRPTPDGSRIVWDGRTFDVKPYIELGRGDGLLIPVVARG